MNSDESKHNESPYTAQDGKHSVAPEAPASPETNRLLPYSTQSSTPAGPAAETNNKPAAKSPSKRGRIIGAIIALVIVAALVLGFLPRWRQSHSAATDTSQLAIPSVSVLSPTPGTNHAGMLLPAEGSTWLEASI